MKAILTLLIGTMFFASVGWRTVSSQPEDSMPVQAHTVASSNEVLTGTWHAFPAGMLLRFNGDGTADFGLDTAGNPLGHKADIWFEGTQLFMQFVAYDGEDEVCATAVGVYEVHAFADGAISFVPLGDSCVLRINALHGQPDLGFDLFFHPAD